MREFHIDLRIIIVGDAHRGGPGATNRVSGGAPELEDEVLGAFIDQVVEGVDFHCRGGGTRRNDRAAFQSAVVHPMHGTAGDRIVHGEWQIGISDCSRNGEHPVITGRFRQRRIGRGDGHDGQVIVVDRHGLSVREGVAGVGGVRGDRDGRGLGAFLRRVVQGR